MGVELSNSPLFVGFSRAPFTLPCSWISCRSVIYNYRYLGGQNEGQHIQHRVHISSLENNRLLPLGWLCIIYIYIPHNTFLLITASEHMVCYISFLFLFVFLQVSWLFLYSVFHYILNHGLMSLSFSSLNCQTILALLTFLI